MGKKVERSKIGECSYEVTQFGAKKGREVLFVLTTMIGPAMAGFLKGGFSEDGIANAVQAFAAGAKVEDFNRVCDEFATCTAVIQPVTTGQEIRLDLVKVFDDHFAGRYAEMIAWLVFAVKVNYESFFDVRSPGIEAVLGSVGVTKSSSQSPKT